jgi:hypothetical protein
VEGPLFDFETWHVWLSLYFPKSFWPIFAGSVLSTTNPDFDFGRVATTFVTKCISGAAPFVV